MSTNAPMSFLFAQATATSVLAVSAGIGCIADSAGERTIKRPTNAANNTQTHMAGIFVEDNAAGAVGKIAIAPGEVVRARANGTVTQGDVVFLTSTDVGKEGYFKKYTDFATDGSVVQVGIALTTCADGELFELRLGVGGYKKPS